MFVHSVITAPFAVAMPNDPWEAPPYPPPPLPPPLPILVQKEIHNCFWDGPMSSIDDEVKEAEAKLVLLEMETRKLVLELAAMATVPGAGRGGSPCMDALDGNFFSKLADNLKTDVHLKHKEEKKRECACASWAHVKQEPEYLMGRTMDIKFIDPTSPTSPPEDREMEEDGWVLI